MKEIELAHRLVGALVGVDKSSKSVPSLTCRHYTMKRGIQAPALLPRSRYPRLSHLVASLAKVVSRGIQSRLEQDVTLHILDHFQEVGGERIFEVVNIHFRVSKLGKINLLRVQKQQTGRHPIGTAHSKSDIRARRSPPAAEAGTLEYNFPRDFRFVLHFQSALLEAARLAENHQRHRPTNPLFEFGARDPSNACALQAVRRGVLV
jgi:hypothetical protein